MSPGTALLLLLQDAAPEAAKEKGDTLLIGYVLIATGVLDLLMALFFLVSGRIPDDRARIVVVGTMAFFGLAMIGIGILFALGTLGG